MGRKSNKALRRKKNSGQHQRGRTTRGHRLISKFKKYKWYDDKNSKSEEKDAESDLHMGRWP